MWLTLGEDRLCDRAVEADISEISAGGVLFCDFFYYFLDGVVVRRLESAY